MVTAQPGANLLVAGKFKLIITFVHDAQIAK
jgi:hypothetical protein